LARFERRGARSQRRGTLSDVLGDFGAAARRIVGRGAGAVLLVLAAIVTVALPAAAGSHDFPKGDEAYHTYPELTAELHAIAAAHPEIASLRSIGKSYVGRDLWVLKISDRVAVDENEPEVLITGLTHAREHLTVEQALALIHWLVDGYGSDTRTTRLVDTTEIWVAPMLNPDGGQYDIRKGSYHLWRKNRQPTPGSSAIGTDINRNYGYRWGCCGGSSSNPLAITYRGPKAWSTPEAKAERDFVQSRVVGGKQQIVLDIAFHSFGGQILYPYEYTTKAVPPDMVKKDHKALVALAHGVAARNGYTPMQGSHLYITDGSFGDWSYGSQRILHLTIELMPRTTSDGGFYPAGSRIGALTKNNRGALLWFIAQARCPYDAAGLAHVCGTSTNAPSVLIATTSFPAPGRSLSE
jgi:carboxypeptidase T